MLRIQEAIIVEGKYDKIRLASVVDAFIIETQGFRLFRDAQKRELIRQLAETCGIVVLTDSDNAGFLIRNHLTSLVPPEKIRHVYIPTIQGVERRKAKASKEGLLGVEGMTEEVLLKAFAAAGVSCTKMPAQQAITKADLYAAGLSGRKDSAQKRAHFLQRKNLPPQISANALLNLLNRTTTREAFFQEAAALCSKEGDSAGERES